MTQTADNRDDATARWNHRDDATSAKGTAGTAVTETAENRDDATARWNHRDDATSATEQHFSPRRARRERRGFISDAAAFAAYGEGVVMSLPSGASFCFPRRQPGPDAGPHKSPGYPREEVRRAFLEYHGWHSN